MSDNKRLIPFSIKQIDDTKWSVTVDDNEPFEVEGTEDQIRKVVLRSKAKDGNGTDRKRSSKKGTYKGMMDGETHYMWKSKAFNNEEEFMSLMEKSIKESKSKYTIKNFDELKFHVEELVDEFTAIYEYYENGGLESDSWTYLINDKAIARALHDMVDPVYNLLDEVNDYK